MGGRGDSMAEARTVSVSDIIPRRYSHMTARNDDDIEVGYN
jgi:hypothetical protein